MVSRLGTQYEAKVQLLELLDMRAVRGKPVLYHYQFQKRMLPPHIAQQSCRRVAFAIVFLLSVFLGNRLRCKRENFLLFRMHENCPQHLVVVCDRSVPVVLFTTAFTVHLVR